MLFKLLLLKLHRSCNLPNIPIWCVLYIADRLSKTVDVSCLFAVEMPDLCTVPLNCTSKQSLPDCIVPEHTIAVEIKVCYNSLTENSRNFIAP